MLHELAAEAFPSIRSLLDDATTFRLIVPAVLDGARPGQRVVYDYSCDLEGPDLPWIRGQRGRTFIYRHLLGFEPQTPAR